MGDLSEHFSRREFACHGTDCCGGTAAVDSRLIEALEAFRVAVNRPVLINSGFRCLRHNRIVGSTDSSQHPRGRAADISLIDDMTINEMAALAEEISAFRYGGIGTYDFFIHVDVRTDSPARWDERH
jgi:uncharacterized protein YcbK (DUF882 family)